MSKLVAVKWNNKSGLNLSTKKQKKAHKQQREDRKNRRDKWVA